MAGAEGIVVRKHSVVMYQLDLDISLCECGGKLWSNASLHACMLYNMTSANKAEAVLKSHVPVLASWDAHRH